MSYRTLHPIFDELHGPRLLLRPYRFSDAADRFAAIDESRDHLRPWEPDMADSCRTLEETQDWIVRVSARWLLRESFSSGLWTHGGGRFVGSVGIRPRNDEGWDVRAFALSYWVRVSEQGHGYISEAVRLVTDYAFEHLAAQRVEIECDLLNERSMAVARRLGFVEEGRLRNVWRRTDGSLATAVIFARTPADPRW